MPVRPEEIKLIGVCDMVELYRDENGVTIHGRGGRWRLYPVEYKLEQPDTRGADSLQLCAQVVRLEEMFVTDITEAVLYYGKTLSFVYTLLENEIASALETVGSDSAVGFPHTVRPGSIPKFV